MAETSTSTSATSSDQSTASRDAHSVVSRVLSLSIFFVGVGVFAAAGFAMHQTAMFAEYQTTYFSVGVVVGVVGLMLWVLTR